MLSQASATPPQPATTQQVIIERPPAGLAQGQYAWPAWAVVSLGAAGIAIGVAYLILRFRRARREP